MMDKPLRLSDFKALTFDVGGTLIDIEAGILNWFRPHLIRHRLAVSDSALLEAFAQSEEKYLQLLPQISCTRILPVQRACSHLVMSRRSIVVENMFG